MQKEEKTNSSHSMGKNHSFTESELKDYGFRFSRKSHDIKRKIQRYYLEKAVRNLEIAREHLMKSMEELQVEEINKVIEAAKVGVEKEKTKTLSYKGKKIPCPSCSRLFGNRGAMA